MRAILRDRNGSETVVSVPKPLPQKFTSVSYTPISVAQALDVYSPPNYKKIEFYLKSVCFNTALYVEQPETDKKHMAMTDTSVKYGSERLCGKPNCLQCREERIMRMKMQDDPYQAYQSYMNDVNKRLRKEMNAAVFASTEDSFPYISSQEILPPQSKPSNPTIMYQLTNIAKRLLSKDIKTLVKAGFLDSELNMTEAGRREMTSIMFEKFQKELVEAAATKLEEDKESK